MDSTWFLWSSLASIIGFALFTYGRRQHRGAPMVTGIALMIYPYFVSSTLALVGVGVLLIGGMVVASRLEDGL